jgi:hypothetical protein
MCSATSLDDVPQNAASEKKPSKETLVATPPPATKKPEAPPKADVKLATPTLNSLTLGNAPSAKIEFPNSTAAPFPTSPKAPVGFGGLSLGSSIPSSTAPDSGFGFGLSGKSSTDGQKPAPPLNLFSNLGSNIPAETPKQLEKPGTQGKLQFSFDTKKEDKSKDVKLNASIPPGSVKDISFGDKSKPSISAPLFGIKPSPGIPESDKKSTITKSNLAKTTVIPEKTSLTLQNKVAPTFGSAPISASSKNLIMKTDKPVIEQAYGEVPNSVLVQAFNHFYIGLNQDIENVRIFFS